MKFVPSILNTDGFRVPHGFPVRKYEIYQAETDASDVDYPIVRYAEILMMKAEALLRTGQADAAAALVSQVRKRDFTGTAAAKANVTGADLTKGSVYNYGWSDTDGIVKTAAGGTPVMNGGADIQFGRFLDELGWEFAIEGRTVARPDSVRCVHYEDVVQSRAQRRVPHALRHSAQRLQNEFQVEAEHGLLSQEG